MNETTVWIIVGSCAGVISCIACVCKCINMINQGTINEQHYEYNRKSHLREKYRDAQVKAANRVEIDNLLRNEPVSEHMRIVQGWRAWKDAKRVEANTIREQEEREERERYTAILHNSSKEEQRAMSEKRTAMFKERIRLRNAADKELDEVIRKKMEMEKESRTNGNTVTAQGP
jgi:hypothetical protein